MDLELPRLADTLVEGTVTRWLKKAGEQVREGEALVEIETDKVNSELVAPADGVLAEILVPEGETVPVGRLLARISTTGEQPAAPSPPEAAAPRSDRLAEHLRQSAAAIPQGVCVREVAAAALERLPLALRAAAGGKLEIAATPPSRTHLPIPALSEGQTALVAPGAERDARCRLTLCYDRRVLDEWSADQLLARIAAELGN
jgi:pyruvate/2-oxoglutarate dehydrogenase complex dihydrolipoamide acyltransferase (E2) component